MESYIIESVNSLPPLPKTVMDVNNVCSNPDASLAELVKVIEHDPMIVANLLKVANSPLYNFSGEITDISQAIGLFGMNTTRSIVLEHSIRKLLNIDMQPYGISSEKFANISLFQAVLAQKWYEYIDKQKAQKLYLGAFLQESGKIVIANYILQINETISFASEIALTNDIAQVEKSYTDFSSSEVTAMIFEHWAFDSELVNMIRFADNPKEADDEIRQYCTALNIVKTIVPTNKPFEEVSIQFGLKKAIEAGYDEKVLKGCVEELMEYYE